MRSEFLPNSRRSRRSDLRFVGRNMQLRINYPFWLSDESLHQHLTDDCSCYSYYILNKISMVCVYEFHAEYHCEESHEKVSSIALNNFFFSLFQCVFFSCWRFQLANFTKKVLEECQSSIQW